jgi:predicted acetyltransferase
VSLQPCASDFAISSTLVQVDVNLIPVAEEDKLVLANLIQLYCYDFSEIRGYDLTTHGTFVYRYLDYYFTEDTREACFITADGTLAGFTMTRRLADGSREVSEFFVARRHRRDGIGQTAAYQMFRRHPGPWQLAFDHANYPAAQFWPRVTASIADGPVQRTDRYPPDVTRPGAWLHLTVRR